MKFSIRHSSTNDLYRKKEEKNPTRDRSNLQITYLVIFKWLKKQTQLYKWLYSQDLALPIDKTHHYKSNWLNIKLNMNKNLLCTFFRPR